MTQVILCFDVEDAGVIAQAARETPGVVVLCDRPLTELPGAHVLDRLVGAEACGDIDRIAIERMSAATHALLAAIPNAEGDEVHALAALLGGFTTASLSYAQSLKVRQALHAVGATKVTLVATPAALANVGAALEVCGDFFIRRVSTGRGDRRSF